jgi:hypothetical protein
MYIKAKYPKVGNEFGGSQAGVQGFGSLYGGNQNSNVTNIDTRLNDSLVSRSSTSYMFGGNILSVYININNKDQLVFTNESIFLIDQSTLEITEINADRALEFINGSEWVKDFFFALGDGKGNTIHDGNNNKITTG